FQYIPENLILQVSEQDLPLEIRETIRKRYQGADRVKEARLQTLMSKFERIKMNSSDTIDNFARELLELATKVASLGKTTCFLEKELCDVVSNENTSWNWKGYYGGNHGMFQEATMDDGHNSFVVGIQQEEITAKEIEIQSPDPDVFYSVSSVEQDEPQQPDVFNSISSVEQDEPR